MDAARMSMMTPEDLSTSLGHALRLGRVGRGDSIEKAAVAAGVTPEALRELEHGRGTMEALVRVCIATGAAVDLWKALQPQPHTLDELERIERARMSMIEGGQGWFAGGITSGCRIPGTPY